MTSLVLYVQNERLPWGTPAYPTPLPHQPKFFPSHPLSHPPPVHMQTDIKTKPDPGPGICKVLFFFFFLHFFSRSKKGILTAYIYVCMCVYVSAAFEGINREGQREVSVKRRQGL